jgi:hypothetical protein
VSGDAAPAALARLVTVRVADAEAAAWRREAAALGVPLSDLIRARMASEGAPPTFTGRVRRRGTVGRAQQLPEEWLRELGRIGNNMNQLARAANEQRKAGRAGEAVGWEALVLLRDVAVSMRGVRERVCASCAAASAGRGEG